MADDIRLQRQQQAQAILARVQEVLPSVLARYPVVAAYVYGSVVLYWEVDNRTVYRILQENLGDFERYISYIVDFIQRSKA